MPPDFHDYMSNFMAVLLTANFLSLSNNSQVYKSWNRTWGKLYLNNGAVAYIKLTYLDNLSAQTFSCESCWYVGLKAYPGKILRIRTSEIESESNFSSKSQHLRSTEYSTFLIAKNLKFDPWDWMWG